MAAILACNGTVAAQESSSRTSRQQRELATAQRELSRAQVYVARAKGGPLTPQAVLAVAAAAEPIRLSRENHPEFAAATGLQAVQRLCGSVDPAYLQAFKTENRLEEFDFSAILGDAAYQRDWPACLFVEENVGKAKNYTVRPTDTKGHIMRLFTGTAVNDVRLQEFMRLSFGRVVRDNALPVGESIATPYVTTPTFMTLRKGRGEGLIEALSHVSAAVNVSEASVGGTIIGPAVLGSSGRVASGEFPDCSNDGGETYPFSATAVAQVYAHAQAALAGDLMVARQPVHVVVIDNGFFGVPCVSGNCPKRMNGKMEFTSRFPREYFDAQQFPYGVLGPTAPTRPQPINYMNNLVTADRISGHGTHVAGLTIGGPRFEQQRSAFVMDSASWLKLVIANLAAGAETFPAGIESAILLDVGKIRGKKIVNLSLTIDGAVRPDAIQTLRGLIEGGRSDVLFVAAAGNEGRSLTSGRLYPARFGGTADGLANVITVASIDSDGRISAFSNFGGTVVDISAPGCKIWSWLDASQPAVPISGTSQSAPIVTFAAAMLRSVWDRSPAMLKSRLLYSGRLITDPTERAKVHSGSQLDIPTALLVRDDVLTYEEAPPKPGGIPKRRTVVGRMEVIQGFACINGDAVPQAWAELRSYRRAGPASVLTWRVSDDARNEPCEATLASIHPGGALNEAVLMPTHELTGSTLVPWTAGEVRVPVGRVVSFVTREPDPRRY